MVIQDHSFWHQ